ncbi:cytochrome P450 [Nocardia rosealba]|uniref:cytochrome P450 n=1 Tax=Nocardia rosealba TaxID=2878563 RepID=UPI001CD99E8A|nr:cytochrome P450 [Nocardia rosealba]MCA2207234.1 cytochrome P450 [Nocardia rosealba]
MIAWSVTRYEKLRELTEDGRLSRDAQQHWPGLADVPESWPLTPFLIQPSVLNAYGADHRRLRGIMDTAFTADRLAKLADNLGDRLPTLLVAFGAPGSGRIIDIRQDFAQVIAAETLCDLFGIPKEQWHEARQAMLELLNPSSEPETAAVQLKNATDLLAGLISSKQQAPGSDLATILSQDPSLTDEERVLALVVTIAGGLPAPTDLITNAVVNLLSNPAQLTALLDGAVEWSEAVEETLRFDSPVQHMPLRYAVHDIDLGDGVVIRRGDPVIMGFGAGGRDPQVHGDTAETFDVHRLNKAHVALGHGVHYCIGAPLGLLTARLALAALFQHFPHLKLAEPVDAMSPLPTFIFNGKTRVPVLL